MQNTRISARYLIRFLAFSILALAVYRLVVPALAVITIAPLTVLAPPLQAFREGAGAVFEWQGANRWFRFSHVNFEVVCANFVVLTGLVLATAWPVRRRIERLAIGFTLLWVFDVLHLSAILGYGYFQSEPPAPESTVLRLVNAVTTIVYHMGKQIGSMFLPLFVFLLLSLRQAPATSGATRVEEKSEVK